MTLSRNDKIFLTLAPALAVAALYVFLHARPQARRAKQVVNHLATMGTELQLRQRGDDLLAEQKSLQAALTATLQARKGDTATNTALLPLEPSAQLSLLQRLLREEGIRLVEIRQASGASAGVAAWSLTVGATYEEMVRVTARFRDNLPPVWIETLTISGAGESRKPHFWTMSVCL